MDNLQDRLLKDYYLEERIGSGGFGAVYRARQTTINREVAVKIILPGYANNPDFIRRFESEAQLIARLEHPHITPLIDYWRDPDGAYLVMRYLRGGSLRQSLQTESYELNTISLLLDQVASALDFAHRASVIHRDIKPGNILLDEDGNAYLADFGIAKDLQMTKENQTATDAVVGSLDYISPEQARSEPVTPRTDIYSLGVTLYEMITGEHPFKGVSSIERLYKHINDPLPEIVGLPDDVCDIINDIIQKATAKDPDKRYPDVLALAVAFREGIGRGSPVKEERIIEQLTMREHEILALITDGLSNAQIAEELFITVPTVKWHISQLYKKLGVRNRVQAIVRGRELNLITIGDTTDNLTAQDSLSSVISLPEPQNPYKGLYAFQITDSRDFFGRDDLINKMVNRMQETNGYQRFLAVIGPSGSGKSSLVRAGLIPALWKGSLSGSEKWFIVDLIPGRHPLDKLETALIRVAANQAQNLREQLQRDARGLLRVADIILPSDDTELVIVIDQFEEVFTLLENETERQHFLDLLRTATTESRSRVRVIITLRADYYDRPLRYPGFGELIRAQMETILPLSAKGLERAIRGPSERVGVTFEQGLVEQIVADMNYQAGALPLLQYALTELFDHRDGRLLTHLAYQEIGGAVGALANRADEIYRSLSDEAQDLTQQLFLRLVTLGEGAEDTRRRVPHAELLSLTENTDLMEEIIDQFVDYRLISMDNDPKTRRPSVEVAHEAILREWERLREWLNDSRDDIRQERALANATDEWDKTNRDASYLWTETRLEQVERWAQNTALTLTSLEKQFLDDSIMQRDTRERERFAQEKREAEQAERQKVLEKRAQRFLQVLVAVFALATVVSGGFGIFAVGQQRQAEERADENQSLVWAFQAREAINTNYPLALRLALESVQIDNPPVLAESIFREIVQDDAMQGFFFAHTNSIRSLSSTDDGQILVTASCATLTDDACQSGELAVWNTSDYSNIWRSESFVGWVNTVAISPDGQSVLSVGCGERDDDNYCTRGDLMRYDLQTGDLMETLTLHSNELTGLHYLSGTQWLIGTNDGLLLLWNSETNTVENTLDGHESAIRYMDTTSDGLQVLTGDDKGVLILRTLEDGKIIWNIKGHDNALTGLYIVTTGNYADQFAITTSADSFTHRYDMTDGVLLDSFGGFSVPCCPLPHADGDSLYVMLNEGGATYAVNNMAFELGQFGASSWYQDFQNPANPDASPSPSSAVYIEGTTTIVMGNHAGLIEIWSMAGAPETVIHGTSYFTVDVSPDNTRLALGTDFGTVEIWDVDPDSATYLTQLHNIENPDGIVGWGRVVFNSAGTHLIWGLGDYFASGNAYLYYVDAIAGEIVRSFDGSQHLYTNRAETFSADETKIISASQPNGEVIIWDIESGDVLARYELDSDVTDVTVFDDNRILLAGTESGNIRLFNINTGEIEAIYPATYSTFTAHFLSSTGEIVSALGDGKVTFWDSENPVTASSIAVEDAGYVASDISPDERYMIAGGTNSVIIDLQARTVIDHIPHVGTLWGVAFSPDSQSVWTAEEGGRIRQWSLVEQSLDDLQAWVNENRYIHEPTCEERSEYRLEPFCDGD